MRYAVILHGTGFNLRARSGDFRPLGFYTTRFVETDTVDEAVDQAMELVARELRPLLDDQDPSPMTLDVDNVYEDPPDFAKRAPGRGFTWYDDEGT